MPIPRRLALLPLILVLAGTLEATPEEEPVKENRLARERSPYLRQHRTNPVDWYPWGDEALARARAEDKPIFLSIGYAACHWCHVMEHESFEDGTTAGLLNQAFVCVKVDREERPDLDRVYMTAVQLFGRGGWPMTVLLTPDGRPFWGGTYLPREQLQALTRRVGALWKDQRARLMEQAGTIAGQVAHLGGGPDLPASEDTDAEILKTVKDALGARFDRTHGGYGSHPKFPPHAELITFLEDGGRRMGPPEREQVLRTLDAMDEGGIHDQAGGGFHRYSTDERWLLPHFEKMLYDNALLAQAYAAAYALTGAPRYRRVVERLFAWLEREMARPDGGYASSLDADTEGDEGLTYTWTQAELRAALPQPQADLVETLLGVQAGGNVLDEATGRASGRNVLHLRRPLRDTAREQGLEPDALQARLDAALERLLAVRGRRPQPGLDDKVIAGWNGLLLSAFARAGRDLGAPALLERARALATFLLARCRRPDGTLLRFPAGSGPEIPGFCEDHVHVAAGLLDLADVTGEARWAEAAAALVDRLDADFQDAEAGGFFTSADAHHETLFARTKETWDSPIPSDNGTAAHVNLRLFARTGEARYRAAADRTLTAFRPLMANPRTATGVIGLVRALGLRGDLETAGAAGALQGDAHVRADVVEVDAFLERDEARPGARVRLVVRVRVQAGWHVQAHVPSRPDLVATRLAVEPDSPALLEDVTYPDAVPHVLGPAGSDPLDVYAGTFEIRAALVVPPGAAPGPRRVPLRLTVQSCDASSCRAPVRVPVDVPLRFADDDGPRRHPSLFGAGK